MAKEGMQNTQKNKSILAKLRINTVEMFQVFTQHLSPIQLFLANGREYNVSRFPRIPKIAMKTHQTPTAILKTFADFLSFVIIASSNISETHSISQVELFRHNLLRRYMSLDELQCTDRFSYILIFM